MNSSTIRTHLVRILHLRYKTASFPRKNEGSETTLATHWTTHQGSRQRTRRRSTCRHGHAWIGTESQSNWPKMRKTLGKPGFLSGEDRNRTFGCFPCVLKSSKGKENGWSPKSKFDSRSFFIWFVATMLHVPERCASHQEQESQALERLRRRRMEIGKSASTANRNQQKNADRDLLPI